MKYIKYELRNEIDILIKIFNFEIFYFYNSGEYTNVYNITEIDDIEVSLITYFKYK